MKRIITILLSLALLFSGVSAFAQEESPEPAEAQYPEPGTKVSFVTVDLDEHRVESEDLFAGKKMTVINFWQTTCEPCMEEMPELGRLNSEYAAKGVQVIGIVCDGYGNEEKLKIAREISEQYGIRNLVLSRTILGVLTIDVTPTTYFVDREGKILSKPVIGDPDFSDIPNVALRERPSVIGSELSDMDSLPFIYEEGMREFSHRIVYYESSRGCPYRCSYCLSAVDKTVRFRSLPFVFRDLQFFLEEGVPQVKFIDRTFNSDKDRAKAIWTFIHEHDNGKTNFHFEIAADLLDSFGSLKGVLEARPEQLRGVAGVGGKTAALISSVTLLLCSVPLPRSCS